MTEMQLSIEPWRRADGCIELAATLQKSECSLRLWWRVPEQWESALTSRADPFVLGFIFPMMQWGGTAAVHGVVSPSLLRNLETFCAIWRCWNPDKYKPVTIRGQLEQEITSNQPRLQSVAPFSCGIDSSYTMFRHRRELMGRRNRLIGASVVMHGFDIWMNQKKAAEMYAGLLKRAETMLNSLEVPCIPMSSNFHDLPVTWGDAFGTHLASGLMLLSGTFSGALIPNDSHYSWGSQSWGSTPLTNPFMGSDGFAIADDGGEASRLEKLKLLAGWPEMRKYLRVCYSNPESDDNCCRCEKCMRTILAFRLAGYGRPEAFRQDVTMGQIRRVKLPEFLHEEMWMDLKNEADRQAATHLNIAKAIRSAFWRNKWVRPNLQRFVPIRNLLRRMFRGSPLSRAQMAKSAVGSIRRLTDQP